MTTKPDLLRQKKPYTRTDEDDGIGEREVIHSVVATANADIGPTRQRMAAEGIAPKREMRLLNSRRKAQSSIHQISPQ